MTQHNTQSPTKNNNDPAHNHQTGGVVLVAENISKRFGVTQALDDVSATFLAGEVHALMGENGAGKSTLGKVISGLHKQDSGIVRILGQQLTPGDLQASFNAGIRIVHQELAQCPNLSVAENLCLHDLPSTRLGLVDRTAMHERARTLLADLEPAIDVDAPLGSLAPGHRQIVQIAASLEEPTTKHTARQPVRVIVFDEPTSSLSIAEVERLLDIIRDLRKRGLTIIYVSHRMGEIFAVCDRVTVLRDGRYIATSNVAEIDEPTLVEQMVGRRITTPPAKSNHHPSPAHDKAPQQKTQNDPETAAIAALTSPNNHAHQTTNGINAAATETPLLDVRKINSPGLLHDVSLKVHPGEIVGIGGLVGAGRSELLDAIFGLDPRAKGQVRVNQQQVPLAKPRAMIHAGVGYVPEDRKLEGLFFNLGVDENIVIPIMPDLAAGPLRKPAAEQHLVDQRIVSFRVKTATTKHKPDSLSGGNQQKLLLARWMGPKTKVLLLDEPTRGVDVGAKAEIYKLIQSAAEQGAAVLLVSSEMPELLALSDRILVMAAGRITGELAEKDMTQSQILRLATTDNHAHA